MPSAIGSNQGFAPQQTQIALSSSFSDIQLLSNFDALELQGYVAINATPNYRASFKLSIIKNGAGVYEIAASDIAGDDYLGSPIMSFQISGNYLQCKMDVASPTSGYVKFNIDTPTPALVGSTSLSIEGSNIVSEIPASRIPDLDAAKIATGTLDSARLPTKVVMSGRIGSTDTVALTGPYKIPFNEFFTQSGVTYDSVNRRFYITVDGVYRITFDGLKDDNGAATRILIGVNTDGPTQTNNNGQSFSNADIGKYESLSLQTVTPLSAGDYVIFYVHIGNIYNQTGDRYGHFSIEKID